MKKSRYIPENQLVWYEVLVLWYELTFGNLRQHVYRYLNFSPKQISCIFYIKKIRETDLSDLSDSWRSII